MHAPFQPSTSTQPNARLKPHPLAAYVVLAFTITWLLVLPLVLSAQGLFPIAGGRHWHLLGALGPVTAALIVTTLVGGQPALAALGRPMRRWRVGPLWFALAVLSPMILFALALLGIRVMGGAAPDWRLLLSAPYGSMWLAGELLAAAAYGIGEEVGWRGFALPRLQQKHSALRATCILALIHALWHIPMFFYRFAWSFFMIVGFFAGILAGAIWLTCLYNSTGGSILMVAAWHTVWNIVNQIGQVVAPDTSAVMSTLLMVAAVAIVIIWRPAHLSRAPKQTAHH